MYKVAQVISNEVTERGLMLAADFDALEAKLVQKVPGVGAMPAWAESDPEAQELFVAVKTEFPEMVDECIWEMLTVATPPTA